MGLEIGEAFYDRCFITVVATGLPATLLADVLCTITDEAGNRSAGVVTELSDGWYSCPFTPDAQGTWTTEWSKTLLPANYTFNYPYKEFLCGAGQEKDIHTDVGTANTALTDIHTDVGTAIADVAAIHVHVDDIHATDLPAVKTDTAAVLVDTNELQTDLHDGGRLDVILDAIKTKTDNLPADPADDSDLDSSFTDVHTDIGTAITDIGTVHTLVDTANTSLALVPKEVAHGAVVDDAGNSSTVFKTNLTEATADHYNSMVIVFTSGADVNGQARKISDYDGANKIVTVDPALAAEPTAADTFQIQPNYIAAGLGGGDATEAKEDIIIADTNELQTDWTNGGRLDLLIDAIKAKTDNLPADPADESNTQGDLDAILADSNELQTDWVNGGRLDLLLDGTKARTDNNVVTRTWFSVPQETVDLHAVAANETMPSVILPNIAGTITSVFAGFMCFMKEATAAGVVGVDGAQHIQVKESAAGAYVDAISIVDHMFSIADSTREGGGAVVGDHDIVAQVAAFNKTYNFQWTSGKTHVDHLRFSTVQTFLIVTYY
jgi:hypothetical protein